MSDLIPLPRLPAELRELTNADPPNYRRVWDLAVACRFPVSVISGRYWVKRSDLPEIAEKLGMPMPTPVHPRRKLLPTKSAA
jgi:hypothetical protein